MELLQTIDTLCNSDCDCPLKIIGGKLLSDSENVKVLLSLKLKAVSSPVSRVRLNICCYGPDGSKLTVLNNIAYKKGGLELELPSLMTSSAAVAVSGVRLSDGSDWIGNAVFPDVLPPIVTEPEPDNTAVFDFSSNDRGFDEADEYYDEAPKTRAEKRELKRKRYLEEEELREFIKNDPSERRKRLFARLISVVVIIGLICGGFYALKYNDEADTAYKKAMNLYNSGKFEDAEEALEKAEQYIFIGEKKKKLDWSIAMTYARERDFYNAGKYFKVLNGYSESRSNYQSIISAYSSIVAAGNSHTIALKTDGTVLAVGDNSKKQCDTSKWNNIIKLSAGGNHSVALTRNSTVVATGDDIHGQCKVSSWKNISDISAGNAHTVGVTNLGKILAVGDNTYGQCNVEGWSDIFAVSAGDSHTVALKTDGTVLATGDNSHGECNVSLWTDIVSVCAGNGFTAGLKYDGKIVVTGNNAKALAEASKVKNAYFISCGANHLLVTDINGRTYAFGANNSNQTVTDLWRNIVAVDGGERHSVGITIDGNAMGAGSNDDKQLNLTDWNNIGIPKSTVAIKKGS